MKRITVKSTMSKEQYTEHRKKYMKEWQSKNPEKALHGLRRIKHPLSTLAKYVNANSKKVYKRNNNESIFIKVTPSILFGIAKKQKCICAISGIKLTNKNISVDHIIPLSKGGTNHKDNLRLVDVDINRIMLDYTDEEFFNFCKLVVNKNNI